MVQICFGESPWLMINICFHRGGAVAWWNRPPKHWCTPKSNWFSNMTTSNQKWKSEKLFFLSPKLYLMVDKWLITLANTHSSEVSDRGHMHSNNWRSRTEIELSLSCKHLCSTICGPTTIRLTPLDNSIRSNSHVTKIPLNQASLWWWVVYMQEGQNSVSPNSAYESNSCTKKFYKGYI